MCWLLNFFVSVFLSLNGDSINILFDCVRNKLINILTTLSSWSVTSEPYWCWGNYIWEPPFLLNESNFTCPSCFTRLLWGLVQTIQGSILCRCIQNILFGPGSEPSTEWLSTKAHTVSFYYEAVVRKYLEKSILVWLWSCSTLSVNVKTMVIKLGALSGTGFLLFQPLGAHDHS